jgi:hypothetical protein
LRSWRRKKWSSSIPPKSGPESPRGARSLPTLEHVIALSDDVGMIQHAVEDVPNRSTGYCTDDVSRAFMVTLAKLDIDPRDAAAERLVSTYLAFLHDAQMADGRFHNFMSYDRTWLDVVGTHDSMGRALWSLGYGMRFAPRASWRRVCKKIFDNGLRSIEWLQYPRSQAYTMIGLSHACESSVAGDASRYAEWLRRLAEQMIGRYGETGGPEWQWYENELTYDNARLPEAVMRAGLTLRDQEILSTGLRTFAFYERVTVENGVYVPVGNEGWYPRNGSKARYCQQPHEGTAMVDAALVAYDASGDPSHRTTAQIALDWYYGRNSRGVVMARNGGCLDGLNADSVNMNMGAESTLAFLSSAYALAARQAATLSVAR